MIAIPGAPGFIAILNPPPIIPATVPSPVLHCRSAMCAAFAIWR